MQFAFIFYVLCLRLSRVQNATKNRRSLHVREERKEGRKSLFWQVYIIQDDRYNTILSALETRSLRLQCGRYRDGHHNSYSIYLINTCIHKYLINEIVERGSSVGRMPDSQSREPGFESPLLPFRSLGIFFHFTMPQSTQLYK